MFQVASPSHVLFTCQHQTAKVVSSGQVHFIKQEMLGSYDPADDATTGCITVISRLRKKHEVGGSSNKQVWITFRCRVPVIKALSRNQSRTLWALV